MRTKAIAALLVFLIAAACSSDGDDKKELARDGRPASTASASPGVDVAAPRSSAAVAGTPSPTTGPAAAAAAAIKLGGLLPGKGPGITAKEIRIGVEVLGDTSGVFLALGVVSASATEDETRGIMTSMFDYVNSRGGVAGRKAVPVFHFTDINAGTHNTRAQATCSYFTEDEPVFAVLGLGNNTDALARCLRAKSRVFIDDTGAFWPYDQSDINGLAPYLYIPTKLNLSRFGAYIDGLAAQGFFSGDVKIGLLRYDVANEKRAVEAVIKPALAKIGKTIAAEFTFRPAAGVGDLGKSAEDATSAVLRFKTAGVNRVIYLPSALVIALAFPTVAESQNYHPRHGINSAESPSFWADNAPKGQLVNTVGVGWRVSSDLGSKSDNSSNKLWKGCHDLMAKRGQRAEGAYGCSSLLFLQEAFKKATELSVAGLRAGADKLGSTPFSTSNASTNFKPGRYDGPSTMRPLAYSTACACFKYTGAAKPIP